MPLDDLVRLAALINDDREALLSRWRQQVRQLPSAKHLDTPTLNDHIPWLLQELATACRSPSDETITEALRTSSAPAHGLQRVADGYDIEEVVAEYNLLRGCIHDLADDNGLTLQGMPFHILNRVLDTAIGRAVQTFADWQALEVQRRREEYLAFVVHDLRTPLNAISLAANVLDAPVPERAASDRNPQMLKALRRNVQHLVRLIDNVIDENANLKTEVVIKLERREFDLWPFVEALIHDLHPVAGTSSTKLVNQVPDDLVIYADASLLRRVLQNLIANAIKYTPRGEIVIGACAVEATGAVECWVRDNGAGIAADWLDKVFDKGESDPDMEGGSGLGLAIVKTFVEAHGGTVRVDSTKGLGSTFLLSLPSRHEQAA